MSRVRELSAFWHLRGPAGDIFIPRDGRWTFNGDFAAPLFSPSVNESGSNTEEGVHFRSHFFVRDGKVEYLSDCTHPFAGQTHELEVME